MEITTVDELKAIQSLMATIQHEFETEGYDRSTARHMAANKVGETFSPTVPGAEIKSAVGRALNFFYADKRNTNQREAYQNIRDGNGNGDDNGETEREPTWIDLYRECCNKFKHVPADAEIAVFTGATPGAFGAARLRLRNDGYVFEKNGAGWNVVPPAQPETPKYTESQVRAMMEELISKFTN